VLPGATKGNQSAANPVALLSSYRRPPLTHKAERYLLCKRIGREQSSARALVTAPANGQRGRPTGILRGRPARSLHGWVRFDLSQEEAKTLG
jgi:hypothetical protein